MNNIRKEAKGSECMNDEAMSATQLAQQIRHKEISPVEVIDTCLKKIDTVNPKINAFVTVLHEEARHQAKQAEEAVMKGEAVGALQGVPVAIKDLTPTKGIRTTFGSPLFKDYIPEHDATFVKRIKDAGAIIVGKTNTPEFGHKGTTDNPLFGATKNPWNTTLTSGGSSGGSAAAVAAGLVPFAEGSDGGGSIRIPSSLCGVFGFKPTYGRVPFDGNRENVFGSHQPFLHYGTISRTAEDGALLFSVMQGPASTDPFSLPDTGNDFTTSFKQSVKGLKVAYTPDFGVYQVSSDVRKVIEKAVEGLRDLGCNVEEVALDFGMPLKQLLRPFVKMWCVSMAVNYGDLLDRHPETFSDSIATMIAVGRKMSAVEYKALEKERTKVWNTVQNILNSCDLLVSPTLAATAFPHELEGPAEINGKKIHADSDWIMTQVYNMTGHPAASLPVGLTENRLPVGMQIAGNRMADKLILQLSHAYQEAFGNPEIQNNPW
jgi:amidase